MDQAIFSKVSCHSEGEDYRETEPERRAEERSADAELEDDREEEKEAEDLEEEEEEEEEEYGVRDEEDGVITDGEEEKEECSECVTAPSLFCVDDLSPVCCECGVSDTHNGHRVYPIQEVVEDCKEELTESLQTLLQKLNLCRTLKQTSTHTARYIPSQAQSTERQIKEEFEKLHQFLREEEEARIAALREEEEQKRGMLKERIDRIRKKMWPLLYTVKTTERDSRLEGVTFLQKYQFTMKRIWQCKQTPEKVKSSLINVSEHVGNLRFRVWNKMQQITPYTPVTLNPNTANSFLLVSDDLTTVRDSGEDEDDHADDEDQKLPDTAERFTCCGEMLGFEGFDSGSHHWVVEVGDSSDWIVGVAGASVSRKSLVAACPENRIWGMSLRRGLYEALESPSVRLLVAPSVPHQTTPPPRRPRRVRVCLDWDRHRVNFSDPDNGRHLYTFMHTFSEKLFPYFSTSCVSCPLKIVPATVTITMGCQGQEEEEVEGESLLEMSVKSGLRVLDYLTIPEPKHLPNL